MTDKLENAIDFLSMLTDDEFVKVFFVKKNGEKRLMKATLNFKHIPKEYHPKGFNLKGILKKIKSSNVLSVFDLEKMSWRSIKLNTVISIVSSKNKVLEFKIGMDQFHNIGV